MRWSVVWRVCVCAAVLGLQGCAVVAVTVVATGVSVTAKAVGTVADAVIPDGDDD